MPPAVVQSLLVEMDARTAKLDAALAQSTTRVRQFGTDAAAAGDGAANLGDKYGMAARRISSAAEEMARAGTVTGRSAKEMLASGASIAFAFGPQGAIAGAVAILGLAIVQMFTRARKEAEETRRVIQKEIADAVSGDFASFGKVLGDQQARVAKARKAAAEEASANARAAAQYDPTSGQAAPVSSDAARALAEEEATLTRLNATYMEHGALLRENLKRIEAEKDAVKDLGKAEREAAEQRQTALTAANALIDDMTARWRADIGAQAEAIKTRADDLKSAAGILAKATKTKVDDILQQFDPELIARLEALGAAGDKTAQAQAEALRTARDHAVELQTTVEALEEEARLVGMDFKDIADASKNAAGGVQKTLTDTNALADAIERGARGALQLAEALGLVDANTSKSLQAAAQIAGSIPKLSSAVKSGSWGGASGILSSALPIAGGIATVVESFLSAAAAARAHAKALVEAREKLTESLTTRIGSIGQTDDAKRQAEIAGQTKADIAAMLDTLIQQKGVHVGTREEFLAQDAAGQRQQLTLSLYQAPTAGVREALRAAIAQFDLIAEAARKAAEELEKENAEKRAAFDQSLAERRLRLKGDTDAADALALLAQQEKELTDARNAGIYSAAQLADLEQVQADERAKAAADAQKRRADEDKAAAQKAARTREDAQTRLNAADGETPAERALRVALEHRRELEDAMAEGVDATTLALIQLAQAAEDAAAAAEAETAARRELEDLNVRLLRAQGKTQEADNLEFQQRQQREFEDAVKAGKDEAYLARLQETQSAEAAARIAGMGIGDAAGIAASRAGARSVASSGVQNITITQADRLVGLTGTLVAYASEELAVVRAMLVAIQLRSGGVLAPPALPSSFTVGSGGQVIQIRVTIANNFYGPVEGGTTGADNLSAEMLRAINAGLGAEVVRGILGRGDASR